MKPTFRKVYGYRDPNGVRELPDYVAFTRDPFTGEDCMADLLRMELEMKMCGYVPEPVPEDRRTATEVWHEQRAMARMREFNASIGMPELYPFQVIPYLMMEKGKQPMKDRIKGAFGFNRKGDRAALQNILDKVKRHS